MAPGISTSASPTRAGWSSAAPSTATTATASAARCRWPRRSPPPALTLMPALARLNVLRQWGGVMDMSMDGSPIISKTPIEGLILNGGWCYGGFKAIPAGGMVTAHLIANGAPHPLAAHLDLERFAAGRTIDERGVGPYPVRALTTEARRCCSIPCPWCGVRDETEFRYRGDATLRAAGRGCAAARVQRLRLRARQSARLASRMVAARRGLPHAAPGRASHADSRDPRRRRQRRRCGTAGRRA